MDVLPCRLDWPQVPRVILSILETYQQPDGSVLLPEVLRPFMGGRKTL